MYILLFRLPLFLLNIRNFNFILVNCINMHIPKQNTIYTTTKYIYYFFPFHRDKNTVACLKLASCSSITMTNTLLTTSKIIC